MHLRTATPADTPALYTLWRSTFDAPLMVPVYETDPGRSGRTIVVTGDTTDRVLASVYWTPREIGGPDGGTWLAGGVANVASAPEARGRGLVRQALGAAVEQMAAAGVDVSLLFTGTPDVYRSSGWETFDVPVLSGRPRPAAEPAEPTETLRPFGEPGDEAQIVRLHDTFDTLDGGSHRPLATRRDAEHVERRIPLWYAGAEVLTARSEAGDVQGYVVLDRDSGSVRVREIGTDPSSRHATRTVDALAHVTLRRARHHRTGRLEVRLPAHPLVERFTTAVLADPRPTTDSTGMLRAIRAAPRSVADLRATTSDGRGGFHWPGDYL
ncbi:GNAT family N-acetyltransferase [Cellulosimicrobium terreum]|nr:GNAT family N-acetyltransferase [Cellulosimicrobium terreum]